MISIRRYALLALYAVCCLSLSAQKYKADRLRFAAKLLNLQVNADTLLSDKRYIVHAKDGRAVCLRTDIMGEVEHIGIPLFSDMMRLLQPSPVYDFLEFAVLNWRYKVTSNQLYLSKVIFSKGSWELLEKGQMDVYDCSIENRDDKLYVVTWRKDDKDVAVIGVPIEYELLNNDSRRNMERSLVEGLKQLQPLTAKSGTTVVREEDLDIYGTEGIFVLRGKSYLDDFLNQNVYYKLETVYEAVDTVIYKKKVQMMMEAVMPTIVCDLEFAAETMANLMMSDDCSIPDVIMDMDIHLSNYHRERITIPLSQLKAFWRREGCDFFFACSGRNKEQLQGVLFACNLPKGYNHLLSLRLPMEQMLSSSPTIHADVYLYIPPISKEKLLGTAPTKKSGAKFKLP